MDENKNISASTFDEGDEIKMGFKDKKGNLIGGWAAEYVEYFDTPIDNEIAQGHAHMWLNKSLKH